MNISDDIIREQLCAWMDGELPESEARFLERRLANDADLRRQYERWQLASSCLKGQAFRPMPAGFGQTIAASLEASPASTKRSGLVRWSVAASVALLAVLFAPGLMRNGTQSDGAEIAATQAPASTNLVATPASADLVALPVAANSAVEAAANPAIAAPASAAQSLVVADNAFSRQESPLPLDSQSPEDFPLVENAVQKSWPRSPLATGSDPALEAYLVRHNQMMANDSLGGFMPYVDVVTSDKEQAGEASNEASGQ